MNFTFFHTACCFNVVTVVKKCERYGRVYSNNDRDLIVLCFTQSSGRLSWWILDEAVDQRMRNVATDDETDRRSAEWVSPAGPAAVLILSRLDGPSPGRSDRPTNIVTDCWRTVKSRRRWKCVPRGRTDGLTRRYFTDQYKPAPPC